MKFRYYRLCFDNWKCFCCIHGLLGSLKIQIAQILFGLMVSVLYLILKNPNGKRAKKINLNNVINSIDFHDTINTLSIYHKNHKTNIND